MFSLFENITPITAKAHKFDVSLRSDGKGFLSVSFPWDNTSEKCWLIVFNNKTIPNTNRNFRDYIWGRHRENIDVERITELHLNKNGLIEINLPENNIQRSFISIDYPNPVFDGGYYYTIDLPEYYKQLKNNPYSNSSNDVAEGHNWDFLFWIMFGIMFPVVLRIIYRIFVSK